MSKIPPVIGQTYQNKRNLKSFVKVTKLYQGNVKFESLTHITDSGDVTIEYFWDTYKV